MSFVYIIDLWSICFNEMTQKYILFNVLEYKLYVLFTQQWLVWKQHLVSSQNTKYNNRLVKVSETKYNTKMVSETTQLAFGQWMEP